MNVQQLDELLAEAGIPSKHTETYATSLFSHGLTSKDLLFEACLGNPLLFAQLIGFEPISHLYALRAHLRASMPVSSTNPHPDIELRLCVVEEELHRIEQQAAQLQMQASPPLRARSSMERRGSLRSLLPAADGRRVTMGGLGSLLENGPLSPSEKYAMTVFDGVCSGSTAARSQFLQKEWIPFIKSLRLEAMAVYTKALNDYSPEQRLPSQRYILEVSERCMELTTKWYGTDKGNIATVYQFLMEITDAAGASGYLWNQIPTTRSRDGFVRVFDASIRNSLYHASTGNDNVQEKTGKEPLLNQQVGESPIDNTVLPNVMSPTQARMLIAGGKIREMLLGRAAAKQRRFLAEASDFLSEDLSTASPGRVQAVCVQIANSQELLDAFEIEPTNFSWRYLAEHGRVVENWGQLSAADRQKIQSFLSKQLTEISYEETAAELNKKGLATLTSPASSERDSESEPTSSPNEMTSPPNRSPRDWSDEALSPGLISISDPPPSFHGRNAEQKASMRVQVNKFIEWVKNNPGRVYMNDHKLHKSLLFLGLWLKQLSVVKRTVIEENTVHRYLPYSWTRSVDLVRYDQASRSFQVVRPAGSLEFSRFRKNNFPYADSHGLSVASGGIKEGLDVYGSTQYEFGTALPVDAEAKIGNHLLNDIEKILVEVEAVNPPSSVEDCLPGEEMHDVAQNPRAASSIGKTQHTQVTRTTTAEWPILMAYHRPKYVESIAAIVDIVPIGTEHDAYMVKLRAERPATVPIISFLVQLRQHILRSLPTKPIDFFIGAYPEGNGWFTIIFVPIADMEESKELVRNPITGFSNADYGIPATSLDAVTAKGCFSFSSAQEKRVALRGKRVLQRLFDLCHLPTSRVCVRKFLLDECGYIDRCGRASFPPTSNDDLDTVKEPIFSPLFSRTVHIGHMDLDQKKTTEKKRLKKKQTTLFEAEPIRTDAERKMKRMSLALNRRRNSF